MKITMDEQGMSAAVAFKECGDEKVERLRRQLQRVEDSLDCLQLGPLAENTHQLVRKARPARQDVYWEELERLRLLSAREFAGLTGSSARVGPRCLILDRVRPMSSGSRCGSRRRVGG